MRTDPNAVTVEAKAHREFPVELRERSGALALLALRPFESLGR
jgi:hypothetical protein